MIPSYIFLITAAVLILAIIVIIIRAVFFPPDEEKAVPITELKEIRQFRQPISDVVPAAIKPTLAEHVVKENVSHLTKPSEATVQKVEAVVGSSFDKEKNIELQKENELLKEKIKALEKEQAEKKAVDIPTPAVEIAPRPNDDEKDQKILALEQSLENLKEGNRALTEQLTKYRSNIQQQEAAIVSVKDLMTRKMSEYEYHLLKLKEENDSLKNDLKEVPYLKGTNEKLLEQLKLDQLKLQELSGKETYYENLYNEKNFEAHQTIDRLKVELADLHRASREGINKQLTESMSVLEDMRKEKEVWDKEKDEVLSEFKKVSEFNKYLLEKEKLLQYELIKSRAQTIGLEKLCEDFKVQIEQLERHSHVGDP